ncbi:MAG: metallophosphoesterase family protein, partial [Akkermansiaceae bacterium]
MKSYTRRSALKKLTLLGAGSTVFSLPINLGAAVKKPNKPIKLGVITDTHIGFVPKAETRLTAFLKEMKTVKPDALAQLGDFAFPDAAHQKYADQFNAAHDVTLHAIGNHDLDKGLKKSDCIKAWDIPARYYTKDVNGIRIIEIEGLHVLLSEAFVGARIHGTGALRRPLLRYLEACSASQGSRSSAPSVWTGGC